MRRLLIFSFIYFFFLLFFSLSLIYGATIKAQNYNSTQALNIINQSISYINTINESGYLFFNPNLTQAYVYINRSEENYNSSPNTAVAFAYRAQDSAKEALGVIDEYRTYAFAGISAFSLLFGLLLLFLIFKKDKITVSKTNENRRRRYDK